MPMAICRALLDTANVVAYMGSIICFRSKGSTIWKIGLFVCIFV
jgi:hypothetical protein